MLPAISYNAQSSLPMPTYMISRSHFKNYLGENRKKRTARSLDSNEISIISNPLSDLFGNSQCALTRENIRVVCIVRHKSTSWIIEKQNKNVFEFKNENWPKRL